MSDGARAGEDDGTANAPVVVGYDGSESAGRAVREAARLAVALDASLRVVWAVDELSDQSSLRTWPRNDAGTASGDPNHPGPNNAELATAGRNRSDMDSRAMSQARQHLIQLASDVAIDGCDIHPVALLGHPATVLVQEAERSGADLLVVGNKGTHGFRRLLGSVASEVLAKAPCSVYVAKTT